MVRSHFQQLCKWLMLRSFLRLKSPFSNSRLCPNTENIFAFDIEENPVWDLNVKPRGITYSSAFSLLLGNNAHCPDSPLRNSQSLLLCAVINTKGETLAGNVNLDQASKTQQNNWWSCRVQSFHWTKP